MDAEWRTDIHPGYRTKIIKVGSTTVEINRPLLDADEQAKREAQVVGALRSFARGMNQN